MAEKVLKEFTYDGYGVVVEVAKRDDQGNNIAKTYVRQEVTDKLRSDLDAEIKRATEAESALQENIGTLTSNAVLDDEVEIDDNNLIKEITIEGDKKKIVAERAINDENGNNIVDTYSTIVENDETNAKLAQEIERAKAAESEITENLNAEINRATSAEATLKNDIDAETARATSAETLLTNNLNTEIERAKTAEGVLQTNIDSEVKNRESAIDAVTTNLNNEIKRSTDVDTQLTQDVSNLGNNLQRETDRASQAEENLHTELTTQIGLEREARINADDTLSDRIERLEGKTTRLYYGEGTLSSPTATEIQTFVTNQEVNPPYAPPYSGIAVVVYLTDEKTYHIWHYYTNLAAWKDDGIDTVTTFTNTTKGIIQGSSNEGYISADNGLGKVNGFSELKEQVGNNYDALNTKIEEETTRATGVEESLRNDLNTEVGRAKAAEEKLTTDLTAEVSRATTKENELDAAINKEVQDRTNADSTLQNNITAEKTRAEAAEQELDEKITAETTRATGAEETLQANIDAEEARATQAETTLTTNLSQEIQDRTNADTALKTNIENGTIVANKAANDSDGNPINTTYVKVEGFKTNYLDSNNVMYKDDIQVLDEVSSENKPLSGLSIKGVNYNLPGLSFDETEYVSVFTAKYNHNDDDEKPFIVSSSIPEDSLVITGELVASSTMNTTINDAIILMPRYTASFLRNISSSIILGGLEFTRDGVDTRTSVSSSFIAATEARIAADRISESVFINPAAQSTSTSYFSDMTRSVVVGNIDGSAYNELTNIQDVIRIGNGKMSVSNYGISIGSSISNMGFYSIAIGNNLYANSQNSLSNNIVIGKSISIKYVNEDDEISDNIILGNYTKAYPGSNYIFVDGRFSNDSYNKTLVLKSLYNILFRNEDVDENKTSLNDYTNKKTLQDYFDTKQDALTAGTGISITGSTISCTVTSPVTATDVVIDLK